MASCEDCGGKAGLLAKVCAPCLNIRTEKFNQQRVAEDAIAEQERQELISEEHARILSDVKKGIPCYLYNTYYVPVDGVVAGSDFKNQAYNDSSVRLAGLEGWKVVGVIPHTYGELLMNKEGFNNIWAGGSGGNVVGAYVLMELSLNQINVEKVEQDILEYLQRTIN